MPLLNIWKIHGYIEQKQQSSKSAINVRAMSSTVGMSSLASSQSLFLCCIGTYVLTCLQTVFASQRDPGGNPCADVATLHYHTLFIVAQYVELHKPLYLYYRCFMWTPYCGSVNMCCQVISINMLWNHICDLAKQLGYVIFTYKTYS